MRVVFLGLAFSNNSLVFAKDGRDGKFKDRESAPASINLAYRESWESFYKENPKILARYDRFGKILARS